MGLEIERKFLVHKDRLPPLRGGTTIYQGYFSLDPSVRFRIIGENVYLTVKEYYHNGSRFELETEKNGITEEEKAKLMMLAIVAPVVKTRYCLEFKGLIWEIDVYGGENEGLITVDVELPSMDYPLSFPSWVDANQEITFEKKYSNQNLGASPYSQWSD
ncbi:adenylate cyclase [Syntrophobotulus glycolicus DSM 8271]|uniref:Adenylate cyclase n=2 Tax=Syntrophobotulus TaxID=51196 RepID=F0T0X3_SYNGF|nr:adenylate cyclase [Syntrophobotulus glycolicus DSM 8271]